MTEAGHVLVLRLAGPMQSWGSTGEFNRRDTDDQPTKSGVVGLLAAAQGRRRSDAIEDLVGLRMAVRIDQPGTMLRDYHTVSNYTGQAHLTATVNRSGQQVRRADNAKNKTLVTKRFYLQDAVFVAAVAGETDLLWTLAGAVQRPTFPLALGRRSCVPTQPLLVRCEGGDLWPGPLSDVVGAVPWQAGPAARARTKDPLVSLPVVMDDPAGAETRTDVPASYHPLRRGMSSRRVAHTWVSLPIGARENDMPTDSGHDPFALLGG